MKKITRRAPLIAPQWVLEENKPVRVYFTEGFTLPSKKTVTNKPLVRVICLCRDTGSFIDLGLPRSVAEKIASLEGYVGRSFEILRHKRKPGERKCSYTVTEVA